MVDTAVVLDVGSAVVVVGDVEVVDGGGDVVVVVDVVVVDAVVAVVVVVPSSWAAAGPTASRTNAAANAPAMAERFMGSPFPEAPRTLLAGRPVMRSGGPHP